MNAATIDAIRRMIEAGADNNVILAVLAIASDIPATANAMPVERRHNHPRVGRSIAAVPTSTAPQAPTYVKPDQTRTVYRLTALGRRLMAKNPGGNNGEVIAYFAAINNDWSDTRAMRSAGVLAHGEHDGKNKALESAIHGMKVKGWLTMRGKPEATATPARQRGIEI